ncbi:amino acid ABC transporter permease [Rhodococcoides yunnanense]|uniref:Amino acid ABC transporter permease n=1 Tax=Rhodococcoides yunnanense TaxID=278209 RepID=A0ABU4BIE0_9NOCA|nr:amino acid ABC transporter permease [Rhodococcus yunnanensis]MDV6263991.1 amino acid ABC transporter permease [Rhodococcus yunnanensis]
MDLLREHFHEYLAGFGLTIVLAITVTVIASVVALFVAFARASPVTPLRFSCNGYVKTFRNIPELAILLILASGGPKVGFTTSYFWFAVVAFTLYHSAFIAEILRSGFRSVPRGQIEASRALGVRYARTLTSIVLPTTLRTTLPALTNQAIAIVKGTALASAVGVSDLTHVADTIAVSESEPFISFGIAAVAYLLLTIPLGILARLQEHRLERV